ncbi:murein transglycosylase A [Geopsychrobacter electrodiphilus]|uniref:murein transglycosylase A n=1 Tax=Geopsychrobacter electrodiphilus TaxID=225196 RepID=UPI00037F90FB|nr:murein transglycosylase A [Geopsychrobacter electrodiphilus]
MKLLRLCLFLLFLAGCARVPVPPPIAAPLRTAGFADLPLWQEGTPAAALETFLNSCNVIAKREQWAQVCNEALMIPAADEQAARHFFEDFFTPWQLINEDGSDSGTITGYYVPELEGSRTPDDHFKYPLYRQPDDLLTVDLADVYPELAGYRLRGRVEGHRVVPYFDRGQIDGANNPLAGNELFWVADPVELFFLHIQGSGRILLPDGEKVMLNYADQNGRPYRSIGKLLLERGAMTRDQMSMQNIRSWVAQNPEAGRKLLDENPSYVFFRELPEGVESPPGALGVPLTAERSLAVDRRSIPLGAPVFLATQRPDSDEPLNRLMVAQDTGGAIKGRVRADFFWGMGADAGELAGRMKSQGQLWVLLPKTYKMDDSQVLSKR